MIKFLKISINHLKTIKLLILPTILPCRLRALIFIPLKNFCKLWTFKLWAIIFSVTNWLNLADSLPPPLILHVVVYPHGQTTFNVAETPWFILIITWFSWKNSIYLESIEARCYDFITLASMFCNNLGKILQPKFICPYNKVIFIVFNITGNFLFKIHENWSKIPWNSIMTHYLWLTIYYSLFMTHYVWLMNHDSWLWQTKSLLNIRNKNGNSRE